MRQSAGSTASAAQVRVAGTAGIAKVAVPPTPRSRTRPPASVSVQPPAGVFSEVSVRVVLSKVHVQTGKAVAVTISPAAKAWVWPTAGVAGKKGPAVATVRRTDSPTVTA